MKRRRPSELKVGDRVRYLRGTISSATHGTLVTGAIGKVVEVRPPEQGTGIYFPSHDVTDEGRDGYAIAVFDGFTQRRCLFEDMRGKSWEPA